MASLRRSISGTITVDSMSRTRSSSPWSTTPGLRDSTIFRGPILTYYGRWTYKIEEAQRHGAAGILLIHTAESATYPWSTVQSSWTGPQVRIEQPPKSLPDCRLAHSGRGGELFQLGGKDLGALMRSGNVRRGFHAVPLGVQLDATVRSAISRSGTSNVLGSWQGRGPWHPKPS